MLCELTLSPVLGSLPVRQMTAVLLKQYVDAHWSADAEKFVAPEATAAAKEAIRRMLPQGLKESISKVGANDSSGVDCLLLSKFAESSLECIFLLLFLVLQINASPSKAANDFGVVVFQHGINFTL